MSRMTKKQAASLLQQAYDALDAFDTASQAGLQSACIDARHYLRQLKYSYFVDAATGGPKRKSRSQEVPLTGLEQELPRG